ncbi:hypothetical protein FK535_07465 [Mycolicibacterium sp. 018/SC-01/001]|uniref:hypothetical protein n=1 Tax=Mycolicibacterium sp. 018/SC-01/001 TaxID=2592069 RepID=UPI00117CD4E1|nr:hypothetical protein [Mycolicibacterium sp. 018/SC-01/001]TRW86294.1 hypothetical protein FK535_07465 [Mycolicibacterium sp. 018/SC-01/001]
MFIVISFVGVDIWILGPAVPALIKECPVARLASVRWAGDRKDERVVRRSEDGDALPGDGLHAMLYS